jgi:fumarate reductase subunit D
MKKLVSALEPLFWMLFGGGAMVAAMLLPALLVAIAIAMPLGWFGTPIETYERMKFFVANPVGKAVLGLSFTLVFWHSAHHIRHFAYDVGLDPHHGPIVPLATYGLALVGTIAVFGVLSGI